MARYDISRLGRLSSPDPLPGSTANPQSLNRYGYSINDPANVTDPSGASFGCDTAEAQPKDQSQQASGHGPSEAGDDEEDAAMQGGCPPQHRNPFAGGGNFFSDWNAALGVDGAGGFDGGFVGDDSGMLPSGDFGAGQSTPGGIDLASQVALMSLPILGVTGYEPGNGDCSTPGAICRISSLTAQYGIIGYTDLLEFSGPVPTGFGGTNDQQDMAKAKQVINEALQQKNLSKCLHKFFGPGKILTNANLPKIDTSRNLPGGAIGGTDARSVPDTGRGTIFIDKGSFAGLPANSPILVGTYLHEVANDLAIQRFTDIEPRYMRDLMGPLGGPPTAAQKAEFDKDIGQQFEECLFP